MNEGQKSTDPVVDFGNLTRQSELPTFSSSQKSPTLSNQTKNVPPHTVINPRHNDKTENH